MTYRIYDTPALVVNSWPYGEANSRFLLYTRELGRIFAQAQAIRKVASKLQPALQMGSRSEVSLVCGKSGWRLVGASADANFLLATNTTQQQTVNRFLRLLTRLVPAQQTDHNLYEIVSGGLEAIAESNTSQQLNTNERLLVLRVLVQLGYAPDPKAKELEPFIHSADYSDEVLTAFQPLTRQAVGQINQSLRTIQL